MTFQRIEVAPTITAGAYSANDVVGGLFTLDPARLRGGALLNKVVIADDDNEKAAGVLWFFNAAPTTFADNAAFAPTIADLKKVITKLAVASADFTTVNGNAAAVKTDINDMIAVPAAGGSLYVYFVCDATPTYAAATDLWFGFDFVPEPRGKY